jgi:hypothetical protein
MQKKWFGGKLGGHVGLEISNNKMLHFLPKDKFHYIANRNKHSKYVYNTLKDFYEVLGGNIDSNKKVVVYLPIDAQQHQIFDSLVTNYKENPPYDYAFIGYRCGSATYEALAQLNIVPTKTFRQTKYQIFYPRLLRKRILKMAKKLNYRIVYQDGCITRNWEKD